MSRALYRGGLFLVVIFLTALILHELIPVLLQVFAASIIAAAMTPIVNGSVKLAERRGWRWSRQRGLVVVVAYLLAAAITLVFGFLVVRAIAREAAGLVQNLPAYAEAFNAWLASVVSAYPSLQDLDLETWIVVNMQVALGGLSGALTGVLGFLSFAGSLFGAFLTVLFTVFMAIYLTVDAPRMRDYVVVFWPDDRQAQVSRVANQMAARLGQWAVGQGILCVIIGGGAWLGFQLLGVPYPALLGLVWALAEFIPGIGPFVAAVPSILLGFSVSPQMGVAAAVFSLVWSQLENNVITPKVMGDAVEVHPLVILIALLVGGHLLGAPGALLAIPFAATVAVLVDEIRTERMRHSSFRSDGVSAPESLPEGPDVATLA